MSLFFRLGLYVMLSFVLLMASPAYAQDFDFAADSQGWSFYGEGEHEFWPAIGANEKGCIYLTCNSGESSTAYRNLELTRGRYLVSAHVRMLDVQAKRSGALWIFYQASSSIQFSGKSLHGSFGWKRIAYTIDVQQEKVTLWFRLRSPGRVWIDDVSVTPYSGEKIEFQEKSAGLPEPVSNPPGTGIRCLDCKRWYDPHKEYCPVCGTKNPGSQEQASEDVVPTRLLLGFEEDREPLEKGSLQLKGYSTELVTQGRRSGVFSLNKYQNIDMSKLRASDWSGYDYIALDAYNPSEGNSKFVLAVGDIHGRGFWKELNHYTILAPGWNHLKFRLKRYVGERGSVKYKRYLDLKNINRAWFRAELDDSSHETFLVDNLRLLTGEHPESWPDIKLFDFVKSPTSVQRGFVGVETRNLYSKDIGFGFEDPQIWRTQDSMYADRLHRDGIFMLGGKFLVDIPNGKYVVRLVPNALGYWNEHFWSKRSILVEGETLLEEERDGVDDYLKDQLRFEDVEPRPEDSAYDLYLKSVFREYIKEVTVSDGQLTLEFSSDPSGVFLNSLIIYPASEKKKGEAFVASLHKVLKDDFDMLCRNITRKEVLGAQYIDDQARKRGFYAALIRADEQIRYNQLLPTTGEMITLEGGIGERPVQALMVRNLQDARILKVKTSPLRNNAGDEILPGRDWIRYGVQQYQCHSLNHETYELAPRFLRALGKDGLQLKPDQSLLLWYQVPITKDMKPGTYRGSVTFELHSHKVSYPVALTVQDFELPLPNIAVGFIGMEPVTFDYFRDSDKVSIAREYRHKALDAIAARGFTTWAGLPAGKWKISRMSVQFYASEIDDLMEKARKLGFNHKVFTYGGWPVINLDKHGSVSGLSQKEFRERTSAVLAEHMESEDWLPLVVDLSDEATGYSQTVKRDIKRSLMLKEYYPYLKRGGYSHPIAADKPGAELNLSLTDISLSSQTKEYAAVLERNQIHWGLYNQATQLFVNSRYAFGVKLYRAAKHGLEHQLGWCLTGNLNYPYYDLDGREYDAMMVFPRKDGGLDYALKFEWAAQGIEDYRLLLLLENLANENPGKGSKAREWLDHLIAEDSDVANNIPGAGDGYQAFERFRSRLKAYIHDFMQ